jgi:hypothetical protein
VIANDALQELGGKEEGVQRRRLAEMALEAIKGLKNRADPGTNRANGCQP